MGFFLVRRLWESDQCVKAPPAETFIEGRFHMFVHGLKSNQSSGPLHRLFNILEPCEVAMEKTR